MYFLYYMINMNSNKKKIKLWRWILLFIILVVMFNVFSNKRISLYENIMINKWDNFQKFVQDFSNFEKLKLKVFLRKNRDIYELSKIQEWLYAFSGEYTKSEFLDVILDWPQQAYQKLTILEGWSIYDIDQYLVDKWYVEKGEYISFASDQTIISKYKQRYDFLSNINLVTLEGFLYPDTYQIDLWWNILDQLIYLQLEAFNTKIRSKLKNSMKPLNLSWYDTVKLSSIVEKEEKNKNNKSTVAWIFVNRLQNNMRIDADISLCYGLHQSYQSCTPSIIARNITDISNKYNTRQNKWLTPTPIGNPSFETINAVVNYNKTNYLFYLHDTSGNIHYAETLTQHNQNVSKYL